MGGLAPRMALMTAAIFMRFGRAPTTQSMGAAAVRDGMSIFRGVLLAQDGNEEQALHAQHWILIACGSNSDVCRSTSESQRRS